jgi:hypothetical protein
MNWDQLLNFASEDKVKIAIQGRVKQLLGHGFDPMSRMSVEGVHSKLENRGWKKVDQKRLKGGETKKHLHVFEHPHFDGYQLNHTAHFRGDDPIYHHLEVVKA